MSDDLFTFTTISSTAGESWFRLSTSLSSPGRKYLQEKIDAETKRADKSEFESKRILEKLEAISVERDRLQSERDDLKERFNEVNDQLKIALDSAGGRGSQLHPRLEGVSNQVIYVIT